LTYTNIEVIAVDQDLLAKAGTRIERVESTVDPPNIQEQHRPTTESELVSNTTIAQRKQTRATVANIVCDQPYWSAMGFGASDSVNVRDLWPECDGVVWKVSYKIHHC